GVGVVHLPVAADGGVLLLLGGGERRGERAEGESSERDDGEHQGGDAHAGLSERLIENDFQEKALPLYSPLALVSTARPTHHWNTLPPNPRLFDADEAP